MPDKDELIRKIRAGNFRENNSKVIRTINILRTQFVKLSDVGYALPDIKPGDVLDCVNYLQEGGYIRLRHIHTKEEMLLADAEPDELEAKVTYKGIQLLSGSVRDPEIAKV